MEAHVSKYVYCPQMHKSKNVTDQMSLFRRGCFPKKTTQYNKSHIKGTSMQKKMVAIRSEKTSLLKTRLN